MTTCLTTMPVGGHGDSGEKSTGAQVFRSGKGQMIFMHKRPEVRTPLEAWREIGIWDAEKLRMDMPLYNTYVSLRYYLGHSNDGFYPYPYKAIGTGVVINAPSERNGDFATLSYEEGAALMHYLFETYGRDEVLSRCHNINELWELCGKKFPEVYKDFGAWLVEQDKINGWGLTD